MGLSGHLPAMGLWQKPRYYVHIAGEFAQSKVAKFI